MQMTFADAKQRFSNRVADYARYRPGYPPAALDLLRNECSLRPGHVIADIGATYEARLGEIDPTDIESFQSVLGDPEALLGAIQSDAQRALLPRIGALTAAVTGYVDHVMGSVGRRLIGSYDQLLEAFRRHLVEESPGDTYVARLFGLQPDQAHYDRATAFAEGVVERAGERALDRLWSSERELPTAAEIDAPGLWLARIDLPAD